MTLITQMLLLVPDLLMDINLLHKPSCYLVIEKEDKSKFALNGHQF